MAGQLSCRLDGHNAHHQAQLQLRYHPTLFQDEWLPQLNVQTGCLKEGSANATCGRFLQLTQLLNQKRRCVTLDPSLPGVYLDKLNLPHANAQTLLAQTQTNRHPW